MNSVFWIQRIQSNAIIEFECRWLVVFNRILNLCWLENSDLLYGLPVWMCDAKANKHIQFTRYIVLGNLNNSLLISFVLNLLNIHSLDVCHPISIYSSQIKHCTMSQIVLISGGQFTFKHSSFFRWQTTFQR